MSLVEITDVTVRQEAQRQLVQWKLNAPIPGERREEHAIKLAGWILGRTATVVALKVVDSLSLLRDIPVSVPRPDVAELHPAVDGAGRCGFHARIGLVGLRPEFELSLEAVLSDGAILPVATIRGRRVAVSSGFDPTLRPLLLTSLGRTGTTWLMRLLAAHAQVVVYREYPYELRPARYWLHVLRVLSEPANHFQSAHPDTFDGNVWHVGHNPFYGGTVTENPRLAQWFGREHVACLAATCQLSIEGFYRAVAEAQRQAGAVYFAEKHLPNRLPWVAWELYPRAKEVILVRDFRDMVCSMLAFNASRGYPAFGRERVTSDFEFVRALRGDALHLLDAWRSRAGQALLLRYEDLVRNPSASLIELLEYLEVDSNKRTVGKMLREGLEADELNPHRTSRDASSSISRWRTELSQPLLDLCEEVFAGILEEFGYEPCGHSAGARPRSGRGEGDG